MNSGQAWILILNLWAKYSSGKMISSDEEKMLLEAIKKNPKFREFVLVDHKTSTLIDALSQRAILNQTAEAFIERTLKRCEQDAATNKHEETPACDREGVKENDCLTLDPFAPITIDTTSTVGRTVSNRRWLRHRQLTMILLACSALLMIGVAIGIVVTRTENQPTNVVAGAPSNGLATLTLCDNAIWQKTRNEGDVVGGEVLKLLQGFAQLTFNDGAVVDIVGPTQLALISNGEVQLEAGKLSAEIPEQATGFQVYTPTSRIVDLGTAFDVLVDTEGATDVLVRQGQVTVEPRGDEDKTQSRFLEADGVNRATFFERVTENSQCPIASSARSAAGQFHGAISVNGKSMEFDDPEAFENVRKRVFSGFRISHDDALDDWAGFVDSFANGGGIEGSVILNGVEVGFDSIEESMQLNRRVREVIERNTSNGFSAESHSQSASSSFSATISINGEVRTFTSREKYEKAKREMFGPAATFGAGEIDK